MDNTDKLISLRRTFIRELDIAVHAQDRARESGDADDRTEAKDARDDALSTRKRIYRLRGLPVPSPEPKPAAGQQEAPKQNASHQTGHRGSVPSMSQDGVPAGKRRCRECAQVLDLMTGFATIGKARDGSVRRNYVCRDCARIVERRRYAARKERLEHARQSL